MSKAKIFGDFHEECEPLPTNLVTHSLLAHSRPGIDPTIEILVNRTDDDRYSIDFVTTFTDTQDHQHVNISKPMLDMLSEISHEARHNIGRWEVE